MRSPRWTSGAATRATSSTAPAMNNVFRLLIAQRLDRIHERGFARGVIAEKDAHGNGEERREENRFRGELHRPLQRAPDEERGDDADDDAGGAADEAEHDGLGEELQADG